MELKLAKSLSEEGRESDDPRAKRAAKRPASRKPGKSCHECGHPMKEHKGSTQDGLDYVFFRCSGCGVELAGTDQIRRIAEQSRALKTYNAKITKWGQSLGIRIPKELVTTHNMSHNEEVTIVPEAGGFKVLPSKKK
jgi:hypothetical protein